MLSLHALQKAKNLQDLAEILGYAPKSISYILYKKQNKYSIFTIHKSSGGHRVISAPCSELKTLQKKTKELLENCIKSNELQGPALGSLAHGFKKDHSIITNAEPHRGKRFVFNIDIKNFFGSIHIGRIKGFLTNNNLFQLEPKVATILAQIMCDSDTLPQGAPTSPLASNLIGHLIDIKLVELAKKNGCTYSRYADDITFSTNKLTFPPQIATRISDTNDWIPGSALLKLISKCGFCLNHKKTRMQYSDSQQTVTGLVVNKTVNAPAEYRKKIRAILHKLFLDGEYHLKEKPLYGQGSQDVTYKKDKLQRIDGMLSYLYMIDEHKRRTLVSNSDTKYETIQKTSLEELHGDFLFYKYFYANTKPTIICEGKTDNVYLSCAIKSLQKKFPELATIKDNKTQLNVKFINYSNLTHRTLGLNGGTGDIANLIRQYAKRCGKYKAHPPLNPTIIVVDNDSGSQKIFSAIKEITSPKYEIPNGKGKILDKSQSLYKIAQNLYVVLTPLNNGKDTMMEDFFPQNILKLKYKNRTFEILGKNPSTGTYSKNTFAQKIIKANQKLIDFNGFEPILEAIKLAIKDYPKFN